MKLIIFAIFFTLVAQLTGQHTVTIRFERPEGFWHRHFAGLFHGGAVAETKHFLEKLKDYAKAAFQVSRLPAHSHNYRSRET